MRRHLSLFDKGASFLDTADHLDGKGGTVMEILLVPPKKFVRDNAVFTGRGPSLVLSQL